MTTGMISPASALVAALNSLQKPMMLTPCWPSAGPTGGAGLAWPAGICNLMMPVTFFAIKNYAFSTCQYSNSTGVFRPKMLTVTFNLPRSGSISSITPLKFRNGPLLILIVSPTAKLTFGFSVSSAAEIWFLMASTSSVGVGWGGSLRNPMTPCVSRIKYHGFSITRRFSSSSSMSTKTYPGHNLRLETVFFWLRTSTTFSIGTRTSLMKSCISSVFTRFSMLSLTFCSWPESVWMINHWLSMELFMEKHLGQDHVNHHHITAEQPDGDHDEHGGTL